MPNRQGSFLFCFILLKCGRSGNLRPRHFFGSWRHCRNKISCGGSSHCHRSRFSAIINAHRLPERGKLQQTDPGSSSDLCLKQGACLPSRKFPMTDFRQRQALSTLTAPAAWGIAPRSLVQPRNPSRLRSHQNRYKIKTFWARHRFPRRPTVTVYQILPCVVNPYFIPLSRIFVFCTTTTPLLCTIFHLEIPYSMCYITIRKGDTNVQVNPKGSKHQEPKPDDLLKEDNFRHTSNSLRE